MNKEKTNKIVGDLLNDKNLYKKMSKREGQVWGKVFSNEERNEALKKDQQAAFLLRLNRNALQLPALLRKHNIKPIDGLSLACGMGRAERMFLEQEICKNFHGIDIADDALNVAKKTAKKEKLNITYEKSDLNDVTLKKSNYDLVITQSCLHHILHLEHLAEEIHNSLRPHGVLWIHDYIGETQFQYKQERLDIVNEILRILPEEYHYDMVNQRSMSQINRREPGTLISPFEAIRSEEIMPIFLEKFDIVEKYETSAILDLVCPVGTRTNFNKNEDSQAIFELLFMIDELLIKNDILKPRAGMYLLKPKKVKVA